MSINTDSTKGETFKEFRLQWLARQKITDPAELKAFDAKYPHAELGNMTQNQYVLLTQYANIIDPQKRAKFLKDHPELSVNPRDEWLRSHPTENAFLALTGDAKILTEAAYNYAQRLIKELDIPDAAVADFLPPKAIAKDYFDFQGIVEKYGSRSWEAQLMLAKNDELRTYLKRDMPDTPGAVLELMVKNRKNYDAVEAFGNPESPNYIADSKKRAEAVAKFKTANPGFVDDLRRIEAMKALDRYDRLIAQVNSPTKCEQSGLQGL